MALSRFLLVNGCNAFDCDMGEVAEYSLRALLAAL